MSGRNLGRRRMLALSSLTAVAQPSAALVASPRQHPDGRVVFDPADPGTWHGRAGEIVCRDSFEAEFLAMYREMPRDVQVTFLAFLRTLVPHLRAASRDGAA